MRDLEEWLLTLAPCMRAAGITRVANITGLDDLGIPVALAVRPNSRSLSVSQGKGTTLLAAKLSAVMEGLEHYHAERVTGAVWLERHATLVRERAVADVERLPRTARHFDSQARIPWINATVLFTAQTIAVPFELVHLDLTLPLPEGSGYFPLGSNGLGAGRTRDEAILHGLLELIERDGLALFYERTPAAQATRRLRIDSVEDVTCKMLLKRMADADLGVALWDMTSNIGVTSCLCSIGERHYDALRSVGMARGYGCHPNRAIALRRALTEAAQSRLTRIAGSRDDLQPHELERIRSSASVQHQREHAEQEGFAVRKFSELTSLDDASVAELLGFVCAALRRAGLDDVLFVDLSRPEFPVSVVRVLVPGLESFPDDPGYMPGARVNALRQGAML
jgi:ribosomal protein S12 methylthiotransferase accessory factor